MLHFKNLYIVGTSHISPYSIREVSIVIEKVKPNIVALELDKKRFYSLLYKKQKMFSKFSIKKLKQLGLKGFLFNIIGAYFENKLGKAIGVMPGSEMKQAIKSAKKINAKIYLIDQDIDITLKKISRNITWKEKLSLLFDLLTTIFSLKTKQSLGFDIRKVPPKKLIKELTSQLKLKYPSLHKILIEERNEILAKALYKLSHNKNNKVVAFIGAGHEDDAMSLVKKYSTQNSIS